MSEGAHSGLDTEELKPKGITIGRNGEISLKKHIATIDAFIHQMPGHTMALFTVKQGPGRRIQTRIARQERIVQIDGPTLGCGQHIGRQDVVVEEAE